MSSPLAPPTTHPGRSSLAALAALVVAVDQLTKQWALSALGNGEVIGEAGRWLSLHLVWNPGAAFSLGANSTWIFTAVAVVICLALIREIWRGIAHPVWRVTVAALLGGAVGNLADRLFRNPGFGQGHVVDFIDYAGFFVGNVADIAIVAGAVVLAVLSFRDVPIRPGRDDIDDDPAGEDVVKERPA